MKPFTVEIHPDALAEAEAARQWYQVRSDDAADAFLAELNLGVESIRVSPKLYPRYIGGTHRYLMRRFPYLIVYQLLEAKIRVIAVAHSRRKPGYWKTRRLG
jgi:toxin ParE1/3/4